jgi:HK97 family phage portal protein
MANWFSRFGHKDGVPFNAAMEDVYSVLFPHKGQSPVTDARSSVDRSVWVLRAVSTIATRVGSLPWKLYKGDKVVEGQSAQLTRPSPNMTGTEFVERIMAWQLLQGTGMVYAEKPSALGLTVLDADMLHNDHGNLVYRELNPSGTYFDRQLDRSRIVLFPNFSITGQLGLSELRPILDSANMNESSKQVFNNQMQGGGLLSGLFSTELRLSQAEMEASKKAWEEKYGGIGHAGGIGFLGAGFKFQPLGISAADMHMLEVSQITRNEIGTAFGVPGIYLGDMGSVNYANARIQEKILYTATICPKADRLADRISTFLLPLLGLKGLTFKFDYTTIEALQEDTLQRAQTDVAQIGAGTLTINEARKRDGFKPVKWGDTWWASAMLVPISDSVVAPPPPPVAPIVVAPAALPPGGTSVPVADTNPAGKALHTPEARNLIKAAFLAKVAPQERKFAQATMKGFTKQEKRVVAWLEAGKSMKAIPATDLFQDEDMIDNWHSLYVAFGMQSAEEVAARYHLTVPDGSRILAWIKKQERAHSVYVNDTTAQEIDKILSDLRAGGASIPDMVKATKEYFGGISYRAERVARTEVISTNNMAAQNTYTENGVKQHEWLATDDTRTRDDHSAADAQVQDIGTPFDVGGEQLMYPGDPAGSPAETCNCRCTLLPVV